MIFVSPHPALTSTGYAIFRRRWHPRIVSEIKQLHQLLDIDLMVGGDVSQNAFQRTNLDRTMVGDHLVVLPSSLGGNPKVRTALPGDNIPVHPQRFRQFRATEIPRSFHRARTSSRTKCSRIIPGA